MIDGGNTVNYKGDKKSNHGFSSDILGKPKLGESRYEDRCPYSQNSQNRHEGNKVVDAGERHEAIARAG